ncbi:MAG: hypothetical protein E7317_07520 [Clostridiales bacterium]|nr:hypothetical protein [Clostridiales bacterium]
MMRKLALIAALMLVLASFALCEEEGLEDVCHALTLDGEEVGIVLDGGEGAFNVRMGRSGTLLLKPVDAGEAWYVPAEALSAVRTHGFARLKLSIGGNIWTIPLEDEPCAPEGAAWRVTAQGIALETGAGSASWTLEGAE